MGYQTYSQALYYQSAAYRYQVQVARAQATRAAATVRIKKVCDTADKKWTGSSSGLVVGTAFVIPIPRVPVVPPVTTIPKPDLDTGNFSFLSLPKVPSAQDLANGIVGWFIGDYIQKIAKDRDLDDVKAKESKRLPNNKVKDLGGEEYTQDVKGKSGKSKADLYWNPKTGDVYSIPKNGEPPTYVDTRLTGK
ncbi:hypothetical protein ACWOC1_02220 [Enterococcus quebecensis]|uniref:Uncharacterized protein n=1 Tax=Enterococcus quebecensis TaxID=903983 RepID=A0A1E5H372_9ENTE|nr:hypothetical protein [Enterococcus quebecensis]OEG19366.1 hypothetical protein BCR23_01375 [Enterococcus quebecensis]OJG75712.1 hypothetical protein RV12_GL000051 [Enterococcus quebecensis]